MFSYFVVIALINILLGYCLGSRVLRPLQVREIVLVSMAPAIETSTPFAKPIVCIDAKCSELTGIRQEHAVIAADTEAQYFAPERTNNGWSTDCMDIRQDISSICDRIHYAMQANDKKLNKELAYGVQCRSFAWQQLLHDKVTALTAELTNVPTTNVDCAAPELCLAQIETLQTNLKLLDWSESSESILRKLEREVEAVKNLLPRGLQ